MNIELRHLRYFVAVAEELHFGRAAAPQYLAAAAESADTNSGAAGRRAITGATNRSVALTAAGRQFLVDSRHILSLVNDAAARAERLHQGEAGEIRIGFTSSAPFIRAVSHTFSLFRQSYPGCICKRVK